MPKLTGKPFKDELVASHILVYGTLNLAQRFCSIIYATLSIQRFALIHLLVCTVDPDETISFLLKFLIGLFEMCDFLD